MTEEADVVIPPSTIVRPDHNLPLGSLVLREGSQFTAVYRGRLRTFPTFNEALVWAQGKAQRKEERHGAEADA